MTDDEIVGLLCERSETAITELAEKYGAYCRTIAYNVLADGGDADECVNDVFLTVWNSVPPARPAKLSAFLGGITRNIALNRYDYNKAKKRNGEFNLILSELGDLVSSTDNVEEIYEAGCAAKQISAFLRGVDSETRNVFIRRYWFSDSIAELSERFGISKSKVKSMLFRTRKKLKTHLEKEGITL